MNLNRTLLLAALGSLFSLSSPVGAEDCMGGYSLQNGRWVCRSTGAVSSVQAPVQMQQQGQQSFGSAQQQAQQADALIKKQAQQADSQSRQMTRQADLQSQQRITTQTQQADSQSRLHAQQAQREIQRQAQQADLQSKQMVRQADLQRQQQVQTQSQQSDFQAKLQARRAEREIQRQARQADVQARQNVQQVTVQNSGSAVSGTSLPGKSAEVRYSTSGTSAPVRFSTSSTSAPVQYSNTANSAPVQYSNSGTSVPVKTSTSGTSAPVQYSNSTTAAPVQEVGRRGSTGTSAVTQSTNQQQQYRYSQSSYAASPAVEKPKVPVLQDGATKDVVTYVKDLKDMKTGQPYSCEIGRTPDQCKQDAAKVGARVEVMKDGSVRSVSPTISEAAKLTFGNLRQAAGECRTHMNACLTIAGVAGGAVFAGAAELTQAQRLALQGARYDHKAMVLILRPEADKSVLVGVIHIFTKL